MTEAAIGENGETEDIEGLSSDDKNIFLYGTQGKETWNATISLENGSFTGGYLRRPVVIRAVRQLHEEISLRRGGQFATASISLGRQLLLKNGSSGL